MALFSPFGNSQYSDSATGALAVGYYVQTYLAGSSTLATTFTDSTEATPNANSTTLANTVILNAAGLNPAGGFWLSAGVAYKFVIRNTAGVVVGGADDITGVTGPSAVAQWVASGVAPTYVSTTSFTLAGDQTSVFEGDRRLKATVTAGTVYGTILTSAYGALTTVTMTMDGTSVLDSGLSAVELSILTSTNVALPPIPTRERVNAQTGTTYTYLAGDFGKLVTHTNAAAIAGTLPQAGTAFFSGWWIDVQNRGVGTLTITPTTSTIDGAASLALRTGAGVRLVSDGTNYFTQRGAASPALTESFLSADQTITSGGALTIAHGLTTTPKLVMGFLKCGTGEAGYTAGAIFPISLGRADSSNLGATVVANGTNLLVRFGADAAVFRVVNFTTGNGATLTNGNWSLFLRAFA